MPFQSEKQRRYMHANLPDIAKRWERDYAGGGRIGYDKGLTVLPKIDITQSGSTPAEGIDVTERDITYGGSGLYQGDKWYAGGDYLTGNVKVNVQEDGNTIFQDTMSKEDLKRLYIGLGEKEGDRVEVGTDRKGTYTLNIVKKFNQGGFVPSHEAGIYGLAEGGRTGFFTGMREQEQREQATRGPRDDPDRFGPTTTTTRTEVPPGEKGGPGYISPADQRTLDIQDIITRGEEEKRDVWEQPEKKNWLKTLGTWAAIYTGVAPILGIQTPTVVKLAADANTLYKNIDRTVKLGNKIFGTNYETDKILASIKNNGLEYQKKKRVYDSLPDGHPEKIALSVELEIGKKPEHLGDGGDDVSIKYTSEEITDTNDAKAELASSRWRKKQEEVDRSKQMAYWRMMMAPYMSAQGGRVPQGYNTGGLSNLFRLKNR